MLNVVENGYIKGTRYIIMKTLYLGCFVVKVLILSYRWHNIKSHTGHKNYPHEFGRKWFRSYNVRYWTSILTHLERDRLTILRRQALCKNSGKHFRTNVKFKQFYLPRYLRPWVKVRLTTGIQTLGSGYLDTCR